MFLFLINAKMSSYVVVANRILPPTDKYMYEKTVYS